MSNYQLSFQTVYDYEQKAEGIHLPLLLRSGTRGQEVLVKLDPGSTFCVFQRLIGERLGFDIERGLPQRIRTATGSFQTYGHEVTLLTLGIEVIATVYFAAAPNFPVNVLGRQGWLDRVRLGLIDYDSQLYLSAYDNPA